MTSNATSHRDERRNGGAALAALALLVPCGVLLLAVASMLDGNRIADDAYMFVRYARNVLSEGDVAWNPGEPPAYGVTSLGYLALVTVLQAVLRADAAVVLVVATLCSGVTFVAGLAWLVWRHAGAVKRGQRVGALAWVLVGLAWASGTLAAHCVSGMDTMLSLCGLTLFVIVAKRWEAQPSTTRSLAWGLATGAILWLRPDMLILTFVVPATALALAPSPEHRRGAMTTLAAAVGVVGVLAALAWLYFGTPMPLPAYAKVLRGYGADMVEIYRDTPHRQLVLFAREHAAFFLVAAFGLIVRVRREGMRAPAIEIGLAFATLLFVVFQRFFVLMIMGDEQRFYYPALPALAFLAAQGGLMLASTLPAQRLGRRRAWTALAAVVVAASLIPNIVRGMSALRRQPRFVHFTVLDNFEHGFPSQMWLGLDGFSKLPDDFVIATTEVGYPGVLNPTKTIVDLSGLNDPQFAREGFSAEALFARQRPDLFMLPSRHYAELRGALARHPIFKREYEFFRAEGSLGLWLYRGSRYFDDMRSVLFDSRSSTSVTGPSLARSTRMWAPNQPASTATAP